MYRFLIKSRDTIPARVQKSNAQSNVQATSMAPSSKLSTIVAYVDGGFKNTSYKSWTTLLPSCVALIYCLYGASISYANLCSFNDDTGAPQQELRYLQMASLK